VGLLTSNRVPRGKTVYFGIIADGVHTHPAALRIAYRVHPEGLVLVTDAISALGLAEGNHNLGQFQIEVRGGRAYIANTDTLCGSIASMIECVSSFLKSTGLRLIVLVPYDPPFFSFRVFKGVRFGSSEFAPC
jgi:N-acetylglucosamine-6-phosphate deacetylase